MGLRIDEAGRPRPAGSLWLSVSLRSAADCGLRIADCGLRIVNCGLWIVD
jgi:hypothetical protein